MYIFVLWNYQIHDLFCYLLSISECYICDYMYVFYKEYELNSFMYCCMDVFNCLQKGRDPLVDQIPLKLDIVIYFSV